MPHASPAQTVFPFGDQPEEVSRGDQKDAAAAWDRILLAAFADPGLHSGFLALAEEAVRAQPGDGHVLLLAATAALLDEEAARAQVFLKRFRKRYVAIDTCHLLNALALAQENRLLPARSLLEAHGLTDWFNALRVFPGGFERRAWLSRQYARIFEPGKTVRSRRLAPGPVPKAKSAVKPRPPTDRCADHTAAADRDRCSVQHRVRFRAAAGRLAEAAEQRWRLVWLARALCPSRPRARLR
jgi:hypothetical protein